MSATKNNNFQESHFEPYELFFSRTQKNGVIISGNKVFARVSKYPMAEMVNRAHSIVRHPDMPRAVFKYMWQEILAGRTITAFVKNKSSDGKHYWVLASVYPNGQEFVSVRIKPITSTLNETVIPLYQELKRIESSTSLDEQVSVMMQKIQSLGFANYQEFMRASLIHELKLVQEAIDSNRESSTCECSAEELALIDLVRELQKNTGSTLKAFDDVSSSIEKLGENFQKLKHSASSQSLLPFNLTMASQKSGTSQKTMEVLASLFSEQQRSVQSFLNEYQEILATAKRDGIDPIKYEVASCHLQISMLAQFLEEIFSAQNEIDAEYSSPKKISADESISLIEMISGQFELTLKGLSDLRLRFIKVLSKSKDMESIVKTILSIAQLGQVEVSQDESLKENILPHLKSMQTFSRMLEQNIKTIESTLSDSSSSVDQMSKNVLGGTKKCIKIKLALQKLIQKISSEQDDSRSADTAA